MFLLLHGPETGGVDGIQARVQLQGLIELPETIWLLGGFKVAEPNGTMILQLGHDLVLLGCNPLFLRALLQFISQLGRINDQRCCLLHWRKLLDVNILRIPDGCGAVRQGTSEILLLTLRHRSAGRRLLANHFGGTAGALLSGAGGNGGQGGCAQRSSSEAYPRRGGLGSPTESRGGSCGGSTATQRRANKGGGSSSSHQSGHTHSAKRVGAHCYNFCKSCPY
mmetsp:Transcript_11936/g.20493  ORF Transcript_11936/g.20493 Transcript_11936/m.20493 type:complete len:223 (-) Transcript_11936:8-676(-)